MRIFIVFFENPLCFLENRGEVITEINTGGTVRLPPVNVLHHREKEAMQKR